jgi:carboxypeptidase C (cathepsin A)
MRNFISQGVGSLVLIAGLFCGAAYGQAKDDSADRKHEPARVEPFQVEQQATKGSVTVGGKAIAYDAYAGTIIVHPKGWDDVPQNAEIDAAAGGAQNKQMIAPPEASMFYVAYFKSGEPASRRPVTFIYNGGPGSSTLWLHMGAFGPRRVVTADNSHTPAAPYQVVNNNFSLLDASDLVFVDAPGTGFSRIAGKDREKAFYGVDADAQAFADFISQFLSKYQRWNSPKYLFGESYGTTRSAVLVNVLENERATDFNGVILLSQILSFDNSADEPQLNPGVDLPFVLALPTYAATAWYHHKLPDAPKDLRPFLEEVEKFAITEYAAALAQGAALPAEQRDAIAAKLHQYTGLPVEYIEKSNLRVNGGQFEKNIQDDSGDTTGRLDTRFSGPSLDPMSKEAEYDPQASAISSAYVAAFNDYLRADLKFGQGKEYKPEIEIWKSWDFRHKHPGSPEPVIAAANVMVDLASAMKQNPNLKVLLNAGYFDLATPFYEGIYEMGHLPIPAKLQANIEFKLYESGHMVYAHEASLKEIHDNVADFISRTAGPAPK